jgi:hypothetical protein
VEARVEADEVAQSKRKLSPKTQTSPLNDPADFEQRLQRVERVVKPFAAKMQDIQLRGTSVGLSRREYLFDKLDPDLVQGVIRYYFQGAGLPHHKAEAHRTKPADLKRMRKKAERLLEERLPVFYERVLCGLVVDISRSAAARKRSVARYQGKCPLVSNIITDLVTSLFLTRGVQALYHEDAKVYELVGRIIGAVSAPQCVFCGRNHDFTSWRNVRSRDQGRKLGRRGRQQKLLAEGFLAGYAVSSEGLVASGEQILRMAIEAQSKQDAFGRVRLEAMMRASETLGVLEEARKKIPWPIFSV